LEGAEEKLLDSVAGLFDDYQNPEPFDKSTNYEEDAQLLWGKDIVDAIMQLKRGRSHLKGKEDIYDMKKWAKKY
jgi:hypothetical protein